MLGLRVMVLPVAVHAVDPLATVGSNVHSRSIELVDVPPCQNQCRSLLPPGLVTVALAP